MNHSFSWKHVVYSIIVCSTLGIFAQIMIVPSAMGTLHEPSLRTVNADFINNTNIDENAIDLNSIVVVANDYEDSEDMAIEYTVAVGDSLSTIASKFGTTVKNIMEANGLTSSNIRAGKKLHIAKTEGFVYQVKKVTNWMVFANQYNIPLEDLLTTNGITNKLARIDTGDEIFVPFSREKGIQLGLLEKPKPVEKPRPVVAQNKPTTVVTKQKTYRQSTPTPTTTAAAPKQATQTTSTTTSSGKKKPHIVAQWTYTKNVHNGFAKGFCTWYAAIKAPWAFPRKSETTQHKSWNGNARHWLKNAQAKGFKTSSTPSAGALIVIKNGGGGYQSAGHVGVVIEVDWENHRILIEDMNYKGLYIVTRRRIYLNESMTQAIANSEPILGFIPRQAMPEGLYNG